MDNDVMIKADHVHMVFNIASEQLNNLKEYALALAKRELMFKEFVALQDISFEVRKGEVFGLVGTNGSGKSTMLKIVAGVMEPTTGTCETRGVIAPLIELGAGFDMDLTARENIYLNGALLGYNKHYIEDHFDEIVEFAELKDFLDMPMKNYSSGMVARVAFAVATVIFPDILIVDEALSVGDQFFQEKCEQRIHELIEDYGVTVLFVSHSFAQVQRICNKAIWIEKGKMREIGPVDEIAKLYSFRVNGIQVVLSGKENPLDLPAAPKVDKEEDEEKKKNKDKDIDVTVDLERSGLLESDAQISFVGWEESIQEGGVVGTLDEGQPIESVRFRLKGIEGAVYYNTSVKDSGWQKDPDPNRIDTWFCNGDMGGTEWESKHIEALQLLLDGPASQEYDICYRVHSESFGWGDWKMNGEVAGIAYEPFSGPSGEEKK